MKEIHGFRRALTAGALGLLVLIACEPEIVEEPFEPTGSHASYSEGLVQLELDSSELGRRWLSAADAALVSPTVVQAPFREVAFFDPAMPDAVGYQFAAERGRTITVEIATELERYFADVFRIAEGAEPVLVASRPANGSSVVFEPRNDGIYLVRIQPELLRGGRFEVAIVARAALGFPVEGVGPEAILSFYGDARDGGLRRHEGIDIFSPRGTLILAASDSVVYRVGERDRGGNIVTLYDEQRDLLLYYAHLDEQLVREGQRVSAGDPIGTNGNTGNAVTTPPHLHIGLYQGSWRRDVDPWNFFVDPPVTEPPAAADDDLVGGWFALSQSVTTPGPPAPTAQPRFVNFNRSAAVDARELEDALIRLTPPPSTLAAGTAVRVLGVSRQSARVQTADGATGVIPITVLGAAAPPEQVTVRERVEALDSSTGDAIAELAPGSTVTVLGATPAGVSVVELPSGRVAVAPLL